MDGVRKWTRCMRWHGDQPRGNQFQRRIGGQHDRPVHANRTHRDGHENGRPTRARTERTTSGRLGLQRMARRRSEGGVRERRPHLGTDGAASHRIRGLRAKSRGQTGIARPTAQAVVGTQEVDDARRTAGVRDCAFGSPGRTRREVRGLLHSDSGRQRAHHHGQWKRTKHRVHVGAGECVRRRSVGHGKCEDSQGGHLGVLRWHGNRSRRPAE
mmetsp:Transcript_19914/g.56363  ORF Transcript_19914/g.56363 Transcript_19914/m.56363 type:complete len:213 (+) Transcript_19914:1376-2014(+)